MMQTTNPHTYERGLAELSSSQQREIRNGEWNVSYQTYRSRNLNTTIFRFVACIGWIMWLGGCAGSQDSLVGMHQLPDEHYQPIFERQKQGLPYENVVETTDTTEYTEKEYVQLGDSHAQNGEHILAAVQYEQALQLDPAQVPTRYKVANLYLHHGKAEQAYARFHEILDHDFEFAPAYEGMGRALVRLGKDSEAELEFQQAVVFDPKLWGAHNFLGILADRKSQHAEAIEHYQKALSLRPQEQGLLNNLGMAYFMTQQYDDAVKIFHQASSVSSSKNPKVWNNLGLTYAKLGKYSEAFTAFQNGMDSAKAYNNLGIVLLENGKSARAMNCFEQALESQPTFYAKAHENLQLAKREFSKYSHFQQRTVRQREGACL